MMKFLILPLMILFLAGASAAELSQEQTRNLENRCLQSLQGDSQKEKICRCMAQNYRILVSPSDYTILLGHYQGTLSRLQKSAYEPLLQMDQSIEEHCVSNIKNQKNWLTEKARQNNQ